MIINPYIYGVATSYDPDAQLFFNAQTAAGVTLTTTEMNAVNQWVVDSKAANIWTKFKAIYPFVGGTATSHKFNLKNPLDTNAAFRLSFVGGWTHSSTGALPNGTNAYANTFLSTATNLSLNSGHLSYYSRTNNTTSGIDIGTLRPSPDSYSDLVLYYAGLTYFRFNNATAYNTVASTNTLGLFIGSRTASNIIKTYKNNSIIINGTAASSTTSTIPFYIGAVNNNGTAQYFSDKQCAFASMGDGLTDLESQLFYQITEKYQVALGRNINALQSFYYNPAYNNETNAFLFSTQITDNTIQTATDTLVTDLKTANIFTKMKAIYPMVGGTATTHKFNLVNAQDSTTAFALSFVGGWTHSANGALPNGTNAYANTFFKASVNSVGINNIHISAYSRTDVSSASVLIGANFTSFIQDLHIFPRFTDNLSYFRVNSANDSGVNTGANSTGFFIANRLSSTQTVNFRNSTKYTLATASNTISNIDITLAATNGVSNFSSRETAFASIGDGLTDAEALALYNAVQLFNTTLARQV